MKRCALLFVLCLAAALPAAAQWSVKQSDFAGSPLEEVYRTAPYLVHVMPDSVWDNSNFASPEAMQWFQEARYGMYIHFGLSTFKGCDLSWGMADAVAPDRNKGAFPREEWTTWPDSLRMEGWSKDKLVRILRESGMKYVILVAKHHDGFHFYDTRYSDFSSMHTPFGKDLVREVVEACREANVKVGVYFSQRDWYHPSYCPVDTATVTPTRDAPYYRAKPGMRLAPGPEHAKYVEYMFNTIRELCTNYGKLDLFNFDACYWNGMFTADMWDAERLTRMIRRLQPGIIINNRASLPGDYDSPEQRIGMFQDRRMWETCMCLCDTWSYSPTRVKGALEIFHNIESAAIGNGNLLLSWGMKWDGAWDEAQTRTLRSVGTWMKRYGKSIYATRGGPWMPQSWGGTTFSGNKIYVHITHPEKGPVELPEIAGLDIRQHRVLTGQCLELQRTAGRYRIDCSRLSETDGPVIVEWTVTRTVTPADIRREKP